MLESLFRKKYILRFNVKLPHSESLNKIPACYYLWALLEITVANFLTTIPLLTEMMSLNIHINHYIPEIEKKMSF